MICKPCCDGKPQEECAGKVRHWTYCDNQHKPKEEEVTKSE